MFKNLFKRNKIRVQLIEALNNEEFGLVKLKPEELPSSFDRPTTMHIEGEDWIVEKAEPVFAEEFIKEGKLVLWLKKVLKMDSQNIRYPIPTISNDLPAINTHQLFHDFTLSIHEDDWRQIEFLPRGQLPLMQEEMKMVEEILSPENDPDFDSLNGFDRIHVRTKVNRQLLSVPVTDFIQSFDIIEKGNLAINGYTGFVEGGFAFRSPNRVYYGTIRDDHILELCLDEFDSMDEEISKLLSQYDLLLVCWCRGTISSA